MTERTYIGAGWNMRRPPTASEKYVRTPTQAARELALLLARFTPDFVVLLETAKYHKVLAAIPGYRLLVFTDPGHGDNAILVRADLVVEAAYDVEHDSKLAWWFTTRGTKSFGRAHVFAQLPGLLVGGGHPPPSVDWKDEDAVGPKLRIRTYRAMMASLRAHLQPRVIALPEAAEWVFMDWNEPSKSAGEDSPSDVAHDLGYNIYPGARIDYPMGRNAVVKLTHTVPAFSTQNGSDHPFLVYTITVNLPTTTTPQETTMTTFTRAQWGARAARSGPGAMVASQVDGIALHWPGMQQPLKTVAAVKAAIRGWQNLHMDKNGWSDIAYQEAIDQAGNVYVLRGLATKSGANGNTDLNNRFGALLLILGPGEKPTAAMMTATRDRIAAHRSRFRASQRVVPHSAIRPGGTDCPGDVVRKLIAQGAFEPDKPVAEPEKVDLRKRAGQRAAAQSKVGPTFGKDECLMRVRGLYGAPSIGDFDGDGAADAEDGWKHAKKKHHAPMKATDIPGGVPVWWGGGSNDNGHVAITVPDEPGMIWSTDIRRTGRFDKVPFGVITKEWGLPFLGWTEDINGVTVYTGPKEKPMPKKTGVQLLQDELLTIVNKREPAIVAARSKQPGKGAGARAYFKALRIAIKAFR